MSVRRRVRRLLSRVAGSLSRSESLQNPKLRGSVWHQRSNGSSLPSSPLGTSFGPDTTALKDASGISIIPEEEPSAETAAERADVAAPEESLESEVHQESRAPQEPDVLPAEDPACPDPEAPAAPAVTGSDGNNGKLPLPVPPISLQDTGPRCTTKDRCACF
ncbi:hypothetical protein H4R21_001477 [Coemansia helicoidea]|uniref:Uncharacterized protein n=1 Tax=Coemansia helicoidea TaxID=1286919 RepID=A0ACC1LCL0_9FUNG|nr:hypothetical protein H4R21_001477 [Coemansia helicoidea]